MTSLLQIDEFLGRNRFAFVGVSRQTADFSRTLFREFLDRGYQPVPVHPDVPEIESQRCFARLEDIQPPVDAALFMTAAPVTEVLAHECPAAGVKQVWMYRGAGQGAATNETIRYCEENGMSVIAGECPFMFFPNAHWIHRAHGFVRKITSAYPR